MMALLQLVLLLCIFLALIWLIFKKQTERNELRHLLLSELHPLLNQLNDRIALHHNQSTEQLRQTFAQELQQTSEALQNLQLAQHHSLSVTREELLKQQAVLSEKVLQTLAEQGRADQELIQNTLKRSAELLSQNMETLTRSTDHRLEQISGKVTERLDEGFKKTNETFVNVMARLATIDEAQKKIDGLTSNVVSLHNLLGDKRSRGAFGEIQLETLVRNMLPPNAYRFQEKLSNGMRVDCLLLLPEPTGNVPVDAKFPLENYQRMLDNTLPDTEQQQARRLFKLDIKKHIDAISQKYLIKHETADGAIMFVPAEAVFAELHAYHGDLIEYAMQQRVWIVSPTTLMAVLNTARAVMKDVQMREQVHIIQSELARLSQDFKRFDERMKRLADNIRKAHEEAGQVEISSRKISEHFAKIESVEMLDTTRK